MKRLISWLLALTLICGLLPMSVFAEEVDVETDTGSDDFEVDMSELIKKPLVLGTNEVSIEAADADGDTWTYTAEKDMTLSVELTSLEHDWLGEGTYEAVGGMGLYMSYQFVVNGTNILNSGYTNTKVEVSAGDEVTVQLISNNGYAANAVITLAEYVPPVALNLGDNAVVVGNYLYTADQDGAVTIALTAASVTDAGETMDITAYLAQQISMGSISLIIDGEQVSAPSNSVNVYAGQEVSVEIQSTLTDFAGTLTLTYEAPGSSATNTASIDWTLGDGVYTATVTIPANTTYYYSDYYGIVYPLTIAENPTYNIDSDAYVLSITNDTDAEVTYNLTATIPEGNESNPLVIEDMNDYSNTQTAENFYYIWTATEEGTVTLDVTDGYNICAVHIYTEDGEQTQVDYNMVETVWAEDWSSSWEEVKENLVIEVAAGDQIKIGVSSRYLETTPESFTLTGDFEGVGPIADENLVFSSQALSLKSGIIGQFIMTNPLTTYGYESVKITVERAGETFDVTDYQVSGTRIAFEVGFTAKMMTEKATITIYAEKDGKTYVGQSLVDWTIKAKAIEMLDKYYPDYVVGGTDTKTTTCDLVANMLNYGTAAQNHFSYNTDDLATDGLKDEYLALIITEAPELTTITYPANPDDAVFKRNNTALSLGANIQLQMRYALPSGADLSEYHAVILNKDRGTEYDAIPGSDFAVSGSNVYVLFDGVTAQQLRETLVITIYQGDTAVSASFELSIENVAAGMLSKYPELIPAMMNYSDCAKARFGS